MRNADPEFESTCEQIYKSENMTKGNLLFEGCESLI